MCHWHPSGRFAIRNYAAGTIVAAAPDIQGIVGFFGEWRSLDELCAAMPNHDPVLLDEAVTRLAERAILDRSDAPPALSSAVDGAWADWAPEASFFHLATKDVRFTDGDVADAELRARAQADPPPPPLKPVRPGARMRLLPAPEVPRGEFARVLHARRTWRRFGRGAIDERELGRLLGLTFGVQHWVDAGVLGSMAFKTSPSPGARHTIEAYVVARRVQGLAPGIYHYDPDQHGLRRIRPGASRALIARYLPTQAWFGEAPVLVLMTAVFDRMQWRYPYARAYRSVLAEAGHVCQTFCLVATWLGLAPFCTMALADSVIERDLGIDGVTESVLYAAGVGRRPPGADWAPWPDTAAVPSRLPPAHAVQTPTGIARASPARTSWAAPR